MTRSPMRPLFPCIVAALARALVAWSALLFAATPGTANARRDFVSVLGTGFALEGKPFVPVGVNNHYLTFGSREEMLRVLDGAVRLGATVVRTFLQPVIGTIRDTKRTTIWDFASPNETSNLGVNGNYMLHWDSDLRQMAINEAPNGIGKFDELVAEARKRNLKLDVAFLDFWAYTGGVQQMRAWYGSTDEKTFFFTDPRTRADYKRWVGYVLSRVNPLTGTAYKDEPAIFSWELMNEPYAATDAIFLAWVAEMSAHVKSIDANHLLTSGHAGVYNRMSDIALPNIDYGTWHGYPLYYGLTNEQFADEIDRFCSLGKAARKPVILSEFGLARSVPNQVEVYASWLLRIQRNDDCAGWLVWRLVGRQDSGNWPVDNHDQFDIRDDGGRAWDILTDAASKLKAMRRHQASPRLVEPK